MLYCFEMLFDAFVNILLSAKYPKPNQPRNDVPSSYINYDRLIQTSPKMTYFSIMVLLLIQLCSLKVYNFPIKYVFQYHYYKQYKIFYVSLVSFRVYVISMTSSNRITFVSIIYKYLQNNFWTIYIEMEKFAKFTKFNFKLWNLITNLVSSYETDSQCSSSSWDSQSSGEVWSPDSSQSTHSHG